MRAVVTEHLLVMDPDGYLKASAALFAHEPSVTEWLTTMAPGVAAAP